MHTGFRSFAAIAVGFVAVATLVAASPTRQRAEPLRFQVELSADAAQQIAELGLTVPVTGRVFVIVSRNGDREPRQQVGVTGVPLWGFDVRNLRAGGVVTLSGNDSHVTGHPFESFAELPAGDYSVQAFLNVYTRFERSDGNVVEMHLNSGAGQSMFRAPGNAFSLPQRLSIDPAAGNTLQLRLTEVIPPIEALQPGEVLQQGNPRDSRMVKFVKIRSDLLSEFWGHDMYIGANVLLPAGFEENPNRRYPVIYMQGHFPGRRAPFGFSEDGSGRGRSAGFSEFWLSEDTPQVLAVSFREANPFYDTSYDINSANMGPSGDAVVRELIPFVEQQFRGVGEPWSRVLAGGSTGGWEALALQVFYPDDFGGTWGWCPDPVDFHYYQIVNVYDDENAYYTNLEWHRIERPNARSIDGNIRSTVRQENLFEWVKGPNGRSGGQWAIWEALFSPVGPDGYARQIWDSETGVIDHETADYWRENYDLTYILKENWATLGPKLRGKIHVTVGDMDSYYLNDAVVLMQEFLDSATNPPAEASFEYGWRKPHCFIGYSPTRPGEDLNNEEFVRIASEHMWERMPSNADRGWWRR